MIIVMKSISVEDFDSSTEYTVEPHPKADDWVILKERDSREITIRVEALVALAKAIIEVYE